MSTLREIKTAIEHLDPRDKAILTAELFALEPEPDAAELVAALERGLRAADGAGMLLRQGALAFELFNGAKAPVETMRDALYERLGRRA